MLKLWGRPTSTNTQRVLWTLAEAGVPYELTLASGTTGPTGYVWAGHAPYGFVDTPEYRAMNPNGTIPTIDDGGFILWESIAIVAYLARRYAPDKLFGNDELVFARAVKWMGWTNYALEHPMHELIMHLERLPAEKRSAEAVEAARKEAVRRLGMLESQLEQTKYLAGDAFSLGDIPPGIAVRRFLHYGLEHPAMPRVKDWIARLGEREGFAKHVAPRENHLRLSPG